MGEGGHFTGLGFSSGGSGITLKISNFAMVAAVIFLSLILICLIFVYLYINLYRGSILSVSAHRRSQFLSAGGDDAAAASSTRGLDPAVLRSLPISIYRPIDLKQGLECSVCLSELAAGEEARLLPKCSHGFHLECIDTWFRSNSTCPLCRCPVSADASSGPPAADADDVSLASQGVDSSTSISSRRMLMISIPIQSTEGWLPSSVSPLQSSRSQLEELKSPAEEGKSPAASKVRSLRRRLSMGKKTGGSACISPLACDVEQGMMRSGVANVEGCSFLPKTPKTPTRSYLQRNLASPASVEVKIVEA